MKLHLRQIPAGGQHLEGETDCPIADLGAPDVLCAGPLRYSLDVGITDGALWANGSLHQPVTLRCVTCLESFQTAIEVPAFAVHTDLSGPETVDLTPFMREDLVLNLSPYPHCDREGGRICKAAPNPDSSADEAVRAQLKREADWSALDKLKLKKG
ncbi:MAG: YceD family protein [Chthoniobacterales bacterium]